MKFLFLLLLVPTLAFGQAFTFGDLPFLSQGGTDWQTRVVANGGAMPSANTIQAMETLRVGCIAAGLTNKIYSLCVFVPDSLEACRTPLFYHQGFTNWANSNFVSGDITIQGLKGDGTTKSLDTGVKQKDVAVPVNGATVGLTVIVTESDSNVDNFTMGQADDDLSPLVLLKVSGAGRTEWYPTELIQNRILTNDFARVGYVSGNRNTNGGTTNVSLFVASPLETHKSLQNISGDLAAVTTVTDDTISVFAGKRAGTNTGWSGLRMSLAMVHDGFTETESSNFWVLAKACRETLGGGTGDPVHDYNRKIVAAGGAAISTTTSNALRTYYSGMDTHGILYKTVVANLFPPDNLTACRVPIIWQWGNETWTNGNFGTTNVSVNGLTGNGTDKHLGTGLNPNAIVNRGWSVTSAGISLMLFTNPTSGKRDFGTITPGNTTIFCLINDALTATFFCWGFSGVNFVSGTATSTTGYFSGNRTAANAIALYQARSDVAFSTIASHANTQTLTRPNNESPAFAIRLGTGALSDFSDRTVSYLAVNSGLTSVQSSNEYNLVVAARTAFGGGSP